MCIRDSHNGPPASYPTDTAPLGLHGYTATDHPDQIPIPMVDAETRLIAEIWPRAVRSPLNFAGDEAVKYLHVAGHGLHPTGDPLSAGLIVAPERCLDCRAIFRGALRPEVVFLSACVVGRTTEEMCIRDRYPT